MIGASGAKLRQIMPQRRPRFNESFGAWQNFPLFRSGQMRFSLTRGTSPMPKLASICAFWF